MGDDAKHSSLVTSAHQSNRLESPKLASPGAADLGPPFKRIPTLSSGELRSSPKLANEDGAKEWIMKTPKTETSLIAVVIALGWFAGRSNRKSAEM